MQQSPVFRQSLTYLQYLYDVHGTLAFLVAWGGDTLFRRIADGEERDEIIVRHCGECFLQLRCVEVSDPCRAEAFVVDGKHDMCRDNGGVDIGEVAFIIGAHPCFICFSSDDEKDAGTEGIEFVASASFARASGLSMAQILNGCLLTAVGARRAASKIRFMDSCGISLSESERQEKRSRMSSLNSMVILLFFDDFIIA